MPVYTIKSMHISWSHHRMPKIARVYCWHFTLLAQVLLVTLLPSSSWSQTRLSEFDIAKLHFSLQEVGPFTYEIVLKPKGGVSSLSSDLTANVFAISNPSRLVIDLPGQSASGGEKKVLIENSILERIRVGTHPDKMRFVIDIRDNAKPAYEVKSDAVREAIIIGFSISTSETAVDGTEVFSALKVDTAQKASSTTKNNDRTISSKSLPQTKADANKSDADTASADALLLEAIRSAQQNQDANTAPANTTTQQSDPAQSDAMKSNPMNGGSKSLDSLSDRDDDTAALSKSVDANAHGKEDPLAMLDVDSSASSSKTTKAAQVQNQAKTVAGTVVNGISFKSLDDSVVKAVVIEVSNPDKYKLVAQGDDRYELTLPAAKLGASHLVIPQFPPEDFKDFEVVMARQTGDSVVVQIYVTKGTKLFPAVNAEGIVIKSSE